MDIFIDRKQLHAAIVNRLLCLQFHDIDCGTERNLISLYHFGNSNESTIPLNILN